jgi:hypothetical protein
MAHFVKTGHARAGQRHEFEILTGRVEVPHHRECPACSSTILFQAILYLHRCAIEKVTGKENGCIPVRSSAANRMSLCGNCDALGRGRHFWPCMLAYFHYSVQCEGGSKKPAISSQQGEPGKPSCEPGCWTTKFGLGASDWNGAPPR